MIALEVSALIGYLSPFDAHHAAATALLLDATPGSTLVHTLSLAEVLVGGVRVGRGAAMLDDLRAADVAIHQRAALATFDAALALAGRRRGLTALP